MKPEKSEENSSIIDSQHLNDSGMGNRLALLCYCSLCFTYFVHTVYENTVYKCVNICANKHALRTYCRSETCNRHIRLYNPQTSYVLAEIPANRLHQVAHLYDVATAANMNMSDVPLDTSELYALWNTSVQYEGKGVPMPFKRWNKRIGGI